VIGTGYSIPRRKAAARPLSAQRTLDPQIMLPCYAQSTTLGLHPVIHITSDIIGLRTCKTRRLTGMQSCKPDFEARDRGRGDHPKFSRDRDFYLSPRDETETDTFSDFPETETRPRLLPFTPRQDRDLSISPRLRQDRYILFCVRDETETFTERDRNVYRDLIDYSLHTREQLMALSSVN